jgi:CoA transferase family III
MLPGGNDTDIRIVLVNVMSSGSSSGDSNQAREFLTAMADGLSIERQTAAAVSFAGSANFSSFVAVSDFAAAAVGAAAAAVADFMAIACGVRPRVDVDRRLASLWFGFSIRPIDWALPSPWDPIAGDYATTDGWIRLHTNAPHHRAAALSVLGVAAEKHAVATAVAQWKAEGLETAIVASQGCAAAMRPLSEWQTHPQGQAVVRERLLETRTTADCGQRLSLSTPERPLQGIRVLDLTRVLAGPVATRFLAGLGADVLRIDPPTWDEPAVIPDMTLGKRCAHLDLRETHGRARFLDLLGSADVLVHGYRADALDNLGLDSRLRRETRPGLVDISLDAYGWNGPWRNRRGFDSLVQMSAGIAEAGMRTLGRDRPTPLPVQALDHATGYLLAAAAIRGLRERQATGRGFEARTSLARVAELLLSAPIAAIDGDLKATDEGDWSEEVEATDFGMARRLRSPVTIGSTRLQWDRPARKLGSAPAAW